MTHRQATLTGILGAGSFTLTAIVGGLLIPGYDATEQLISETYATGTEHGLALRLLGIIPSGLLLALFAFAGLRLLPGNTWTRLGSNGLGTFYGLGTVVAGIFPCASGCDMELADPGTAQVVHLVAGLLTYLFVPVCILFLGIGLRRSPHHRKLSTLGITIGAASGLLVLVFLSGPERPGLVQRAIEALFVLWTTACAWAIKAPVPAPRRASG